MTRETKLYAAGGQLEQIMGKNQEKEREKQKQKQSSDGDEEHDYSGKCVTFLNIFSFVAGVAMAAVGGMIIYRAIDNGIAMATTMPPRMFPSKRNRTAMTRRPPSSRFFCTVWMVRSTSSVRS